MRKLAWASLSFSAAIFMAHYIIPHEYTVNIIIALLFLALLGSFLLRGNRRICILLISVFSVLGLLRYDLQVRSKLDPTESFIGQSCEITAVVTEFPQEYDTYSRITVRLLGEDIPNCKAILYQYDDCAELLPGQVIRATVKFSSAQEASGEETDTYISKGIYLRGYLQSEITVDDSQKISWRYAPVYFGKWIQETIDQFVPQRASVFMKALLTGDKTDLYNEPQLYHALSKSGAAHIVAVSGMHVSFLIGMVLLLTGSRRGWLISIAAIILFALMTGLSPSVLRAAFMQVLFLLAPVLRRESDGITSISFALFLLLFFNPFSAASVSLQLSFASMAGIILLTPKILAWLQEKGKNIEGRARSLVSYVSASIATSLGVSIFTAPLCAYYFGYISLLAPLTNLLILWIVPLCFGGGFLVCVLSILSGKLAALTGTVVGCGVEFIYWITQSVAQSPLTAVYLPENLLVFWFVAAYLIIGVTYWAKGNKPYRPLLPLCLVIVGLFSLLIGVMRYYQNGTTVAAVDVGQGQSIVVMDQDTTVLVDCGGAYDAGQRTADWLYTHGRYNVDLLILTHFDKDHVNGVTALMNAIPVTQLVCSDLLLSEGEKAQLSEIVDCASNFGTEITYISEPVQFALDDIKITAYMFDKSDSNDGVIVLAQIDDFDMLITGDADQERELELLLADALPDGECIVVGHHGAKTSTGEPILDAFSPEIAFISCGYNHYGHPTQEVLDRLQKKNVIIYRTDELGSVEIKVR